MSYYIVRELDNNKHIEDLRHFGNAVARARAASEARNNQPIGIYHRTPPYERLEAIVIDNNVFVLTDIDSEEPPDTIA